METIFVQSIGIIAYIILIFMYQAKTKTQMMILQFAMQFAFFLQYFFLGPIAYVGAFISIVAMLRAFVFANRNSWAKSKNWLILFLFVFVFITIFNWKSNADIFSLIGIIASTVALWVKDIKLIRRLLIVSSAFWLVYNTSVGFYAGIIGEFVGVISNMVAMYRYDIDFSKLRKKIIN